MWDFIGKIISQNFSAITGLLGVFVGAWLVNRQNFLQRQFDYYKMQLCELYSPLVGIRKEIQILSEFRVIGENAAQEWWKKVSETGSRIQDPIEASKFYNKEGKWIGSQINYENEQLTDKIIPAYRQMVEIFKNNYWLAEDRTKEYFPVLVKFIEAWERFLSNTHPRDVINKISVSEKELMPFYEHLEETVNLLKEKLGGGDG